MRAFEKIPDLFDPEKDQEAVAIIDRTVAGRGEGAAAGRREVTYRELRERIAVARANLRRTHSVQPGDHIVLLGGNSVHFLAAYFAAMSLGAVVAPLNPAFETEILRGILADLRPRVVLVDETAPDTGSDVAAPLEEIDVGGDAWRDPVDFDADATALILYTSGSTGAPKGVMLSHAALAGSLSDMKAEIAALQGARVIVGAPLFHMGALNYVHMWFAGHGLISLLSRFDAAAFLDAVEEDGVTVVGGVPPMIPRLAKVAAKTGKGPFPGVGLVAVGSAPLTEGVIADARKLFPNAMVLNNYGTTEIGPSVFGGHPEGLMRPLTSIGYPRDPSTVRLVDGENDDAGVLEVKAKSLMKGYLNREKETRARITDGWYRTGDLMRRDENGFFFCEGREDDMFLCNGENVYPVECETLLETHPDIVQAAVVPVKDEKSGEIPVAFVVPAAGRRPSEDDVRRFTRENGPAFRHPRRVHFLDSMPMSAVNKIDKSVLKKYASGEKNLP